MKYHNKKKHWQPNPSQELLLKSALLDGQSMRQAFGDWAANTSLDQVDYASYRLFPLVYQNLKKEGLHHPYIKNIKKAYVETWAKNKVLFRKTVPILLAFTESDIDTLVLKGVSLTLNYYRDFGLRPMSDVDLLISAKHFDEATSLLQQLGWTPQLKSPDESLPTFLSMHHALNFTNSEGYSIDLHSHALKVCLSSDADIDFWKGALPLEIEGIHTQCLNPTDELYHTCIHGAEWNPMPPIRWIADAVSILNSRVEIDWDRMISQAKKHRMPLQLFDSMQYLQDCFNIPIPTKFFSSLKAIPITKQEKREYLIQNKFPYLSFYMPTIAYYPRIAQDTGRQPGLIGYLKYWQTLMELDHIWQAPLSFLWSTMKRLLGRESQ